MAIQFPCASCGKPQQAMNVLAGKKYTCACGASMTVPMPDGSTAPSPSPSTSAAPAPVSAAPSPASPLSDVVDCGGCGRMFDRREEKCPFCFTPRGMGTSGRGARQGSFYKDMFMAFEWGIGGVLPLMVRIIGVCAVGLFAMLLLYVIGTKSPVFGIGVFAILGCALLGHLYAVSFQAIKAGADRLEEFPPLPSPFEFRDSLLPFLQMMGWIIFCFAPLAILQLLAVSAQSCVLQALSIPLFMITWPVFTLGYLAIAVHDRLFSVSPLGIVKSVIRNPLPVLFTLAMVLLAYAAGVAAVIIAFLIAAGAGMVSAARGAQAVVILYLFIAFMVSMPIMTYTWSVIWRMLGIFYYHHEDKLTLVRRGG